MSEYLNGSIVDEDPDIHSLPGFAERMERAREELRSLITAQRAKISDLEKALAAEKTLLARYVSDSDTFAGRAVEAAEKPRRRRPGKAAVATAPMRPSAPEARPLGTVRLSPGGVRIPDAGVDTEEVYALSATESRIHDLLEERGVLSISEIEEALGLDPENRTATRASLARMVRGINPGTGKPWIAVTGVKRGTKYGPAF